jgi:hypothetical protein
MRTRSRAWMFGVMAAVLAFVSGAAAQTARKDVGEAPGIIPSGFGEAIDRDIMTIRNATAKFKTTEAAEAAGYKRVTDCVQHQPAGAMGYHFQNNALLDTTLDLEHPEVLVYEKMPDGTFQLNGVEFLVPISAWKSTEPPRIMGQALTKVDSIGFWFLHVWTWKPSPSGLFAPWNPDVKCLDASSTSHQIRYCRRSDAHQFSTRQGAIFLVHVLMEGLLARMLVTGYPVFTLCRL